MKRFVQKRLALVLALLLVSSCLPGAALADSASSPPPPTAEYAPIEPIETAPAMLGPLELWRLAYEGGNPTADLNLSFGFTQPVLSESGSVTIDNGAKVEFIPRPGDNFGNPRYECTITGWKPQTTYELTFSGFKSEAGAEMQPVTKSLFVPFKTLEPPIPKVSNAEPAAFAISPNTKTLRLRFDRDVKPNWDLAHLNGKEVAFRMSGKRTIAVTLPALKPGTEYELQCELLFTEDITKGNANVTNENVIYARYDFSTTGSAPASQIPFIDSVTSVAAGGAPRITFNFSEAMYSFGDITLNGEKITGEEWDDTGKAMILPLPGLKPKTEYALVLDGRFVSEANRVRMKPVKYTFETGASAGARVKLAAVGGE